MQISLGYDFTFNFVQPTPVLALLHVRPEHEPQMVAPDRLAITGPGGENVDYGQYVDAFGNRCTRFMAPAGRVSLSARGVIEVPTTLDTVDWSRRQLRVEEMPNEVIEYLLPSRFCESDRLQGFAWEKFGHVPEGWARVQAVIDFVHTHITFGYHHANPQKGAYMAWEEAKGVCRDFAHLGVTLCRALNIPARYCTGYIGDIGVPLPDAPMDFAGWFEVYLADGWVTADPRNYAPRIGRVVMGRGRDAADVALTTTFGPNTLEKFVVYTDEIVPPGGQPTDPGLSAQAARAAGLPMLSAGSTPVAGQVAREGAPTKQEL